MMISLKAICCLFVVLCLAQCKAEKQQQQQQQKEASPEQQAAMNRQMQKLQEFLIQAEKEGNADRPMMIKNVDGKMVMEEIPADILANFQFPEMEKEEV